MDINSREFYETNSEYFASLEAKQMHPLWFRDYYNAVLENTASTSRILDCGCGTGITTASIHTSRPNILGVDFSERFISRARQRGDFFSVMDLRSLAFANHQFDLVCSADAIEHVPNIDRALTEMDRVLRPGGFLILQTPNLSCNIVSFNYRRSVSAVARRLKYYAADLINPELRTIEKYQLDVIDGDRDAFTLISPLWLKAWLKKRRYRLKTFTTYSVFFETGALTTFALNVLSKSPVARHLGGRIVLAAEKLS
jgi:ubiquinone/menaquinone biosynthesis C-methylase UbiE